MTMTKIQILILAVAIIFGQSECARILCIYAFPSPSHHMVLRQHTTALAEKGHELVVVTTDLSNPEGKPHPNITEILIDKAYDAIQRALFSHESNLRGLKCTVDQLFNTPYYVLEIYDAVWDNPKFKAIHEDNSEKFDLVIVDGILLAPLVFARRFNASLIWFSTLHGITEQYNAIGAPTRHPFLYPLIFKERTHDLTIWEKLGQLQFEAKFSMFAQKVLDQENEFLKKRYGKNAPTIADLEDDIDLLFINSNPIFEGNRPVPPNVIHLGGGIHMKAVKPLPEDLKSYLDSSTKGVVYVSFGSNVRPSVMDADLLDEFLTAFENLPYDVIWKFDTEELVRKPKNIRFGQWFPQRDMLMHPNIKLFITQAGLQSTDEAIDAGVPLIGIPMVAEQSFNSERYMKLGIGLKLDIMDVTAESLTESINTIVNNKSYYDNIKKLRTLIKDQPMTGLERAVWWTEYLLRHGNAKHLRSPQANISWSKYLELELVSLVLSLVVSAMCFFILVIRNVRKIYGRLVNIQKMKAS